MLGFVVYLSALEAEKPFGFGQEAAEHRFGSFCKEIELWIYGPGQAQPSPSQGRAQQPEFWWRRWQWQQQRRRRRWQQQRQLGPLTLFGDGYSWVDNTDYVVIA